MKNLKKEKEAGSLVNLIVKIKILNMKNVIIFLIVLIGFQSCNQEQKNENSENKDVYTNYDLLIFQMNNQRIGVFKNRSVIISETWEYNSLSNEIQNEKGEIENVFEPKNRKRCKKKISKLDRDSLFYYALRIIENPVEFSRYHKGGRLSISLENTESLCRRCIFQSKYSTKDAFSIEGDRISYILIKNIELVKKFR